MAPKKILQFVHSCETWRYLIQNSRISPVALWVASDIWLVPFNSLTPVVTLFIVKDSKKLNCWVNIFLVTQAVIAYFLLKLAAKSQCAPSARRQVSTCLRASCLRQWQFVLKSHVWACAVAWLRSAMAGCLYKHHSKHSSNSDFDHTFMPCSCYMLFTAEQRVGYQISWVDLQREVNCPWNL